MLRPVATTVLLSLAAWTAGCAHLPEGTASRSATVPAAALSPAAPEHPGMPAMMERMERMQALMAQIRATADPVERGKLMAQHREQMQAQMMAMRGMAMAGPQDGSEARGRMMQGGMSCSMEGHAQMQARMSMMQMMMEQMVEREAVGHEH